MFLKKKPASPSAAETSPTGSPASKDSNNTASAFTSFLKQKSGGTQPVKMNVIVQVLKYVSLIGFCVTFFLYIWLLMDLEPETKYLGVFALKENVGEKHARLKKEKSTLQNDVDSLKSEIAKKEEQIRTGLFSEYSEEIEKIRSQQFVWFDEPDEDDPDKTIIGLLNTPTHIAEYINSADYKPVTTLVGGGDTLPTSEEASTNQIEVSDVIATREVITFKFVALNTFDRVFALASNFIDMLNYFPFFENAEIRKFERDVNDRGREELGMNLKVDVESFNEEDATQEQYSSFDEWFQKAEQLRKEEELLKSKSLGTPSVRPNPSSGPRPGPRPNSSPSS